MFKKILVLGLFCSINSYAVDFTVDLGVTRPSHSNEGIWWQEKYPHSNLSKPAFSYTLRADQTIADGWSVGAGYTQVGHFTLHALAIASDNAYHHNVDYPTSNWYGDERIHAIFVLLRKTVGDWYVEAGPVRTRSSFTETIPDLIPCIDAECYTPGDKKYFVQVGTHGKYQTNIRAMAGLGYKFNDKWDISIHAYPTKITGSLDHNHGVGGPGITKSYSPQFTVGYTFW